MDVFFQVQKLNVILFYFWSHIVGLPLACFYGVQGYTDVKKRSLLSSMENHVTVLLEAGKPIYTAS